MILLFTSLITGSSSGKSLERASIEVLLLLSLSFDALQASLLPSIVQSLFVRLAEQILYALNFGADDILSLLSLLLVLAREHLSHTSSALAVALFVDSVWIVQTAYSGFGGLLQILLRYLLALLFRHDLLNVLVFDAEVRLHLRTSL